jgi:hypothetical protein
MGSLRALYDILEVTRVFGICIMTSWVQTGQRAAGLLGV